MVAKGCNDDSEARCPRCEMRAGLIRRLIEDDPADEMLLDSLLDCVEAIRFVGKAAVPGRPEWAAVAADELLELVGLIEEVAAPEGEEGER